MKELKITTLRTSLVGQQCEYTINNQKWLCKIVEICYNQATDYDFDTLTIFLQELTSTNIKLRDTNCQIRWDDVQKLIDDKYIQYITPRRKESIQLLDKKKVAIRELVKSATPKLMGKMLTYSTQYSFTRKVVDIQTSFIGDYISIETQDKDGTEHSVQIDADELENLIKCEQSVKSNTDASAECWGQTSFLLRDEISEEKS